MSDDGVPTDDLLADDLLAMAKALTKLTSEAHRLIPPNRELADLVTGHLGVDPAELGAVGRSIPVVDRPNLQLALDDIMADQSEGRLVGVPSQLVHYGGFSLSSVLAGRFIGPAEPVPPAYDELPIDVDETIGCVQAGLWLIRHDGEPVVIGLVPGPDHGPPDSRDLRLEVFAVAPGLAETVLADLAERMSERNVYRSKMLSFTFSQYGEFGIDFIPRPETTTDELILPSDDLAAIERHTITFARHSDALLAAGQKLKRGLLLFGPPGTGKTLTVGYLAASMPERTVVVLQGPSLGALGQAAAIVRALSPSMLVIEDVDLIATARGYEGMDAQPLLFQLLNEMDGLAPTDDVLFVLTTNRLDMIEPALAARPGRIDLAVEIDVPDADGRRRLLDLYLSSCRHEVTELDPFVDRTDGVTASFIAELVRRAVLLAVESGDDVITSDHLDRATTDLQQRAATLDSRMGTDPGDLPNGNYL